LNLQEPEGRHILEGLVSQADVLIETYRPGVMDDWGIGYEQLKEINPGWSLHLSRRMDNSAHEP